MLIRTLWTATLILFSPPLWAAEYCHEKDLVLDREMVLNFAGGFATEIQLPTRRGEELVPSMGRVQLGSSGDPQLWTIFQNSGHGSVGIEYMVYKLEIRIGDERESDSQLISQDFSQDCTSPGQSVGYGARLRLPVMKIEPRANGEPRGLERVRVRVWGWQ